MAEKTIRFVRRNDGNATVYSVENTAQSLWTNKVFEEVCRPPGKGTKEFGELGKPIEWGTPKLVAAGTGEETLPTDWHTQPMPAVVTPMDAEGRKGVDERYKLALGFTVYHDSRKDRKFPTDKERMVCYVAGIPLQLVPSENGENTLEPARREAPRSAWGLAPHLWADSKEDMKVLDKMLTEAVVRVKEYYDYPRGTETTRARIQGFYDWLVATQRDVQLRVQLGGARYRNLPWRGTTIQGMTNEAYLGLHEVVLPILLECTLRHQLSEEQVQKLLEAAKGRGEEAWINTGPQHQRHPLWGLLPGIFEASPDEEEELDVYRTEFPEWWEKRWGADWKSAGDEYVQPTRMGNVGLVSFRKDWPVQEEDNEYREGWRRHIPRPQWEHLKDALKAGHALVLPAWFARRVAQSNGCPARPCFGDIPSHLRGEEGTLQAAGQMRQGISNDHWVGMGPGAAYTTISETPQEWMDQYDLLLSTLMSEKPDDLQRQREGKAISLITGLPMLCWQTGKKWRILQVYARCCEERNDPLAFHHTGAALQWAHRVGGGRGVVHKTTVGKVWKYLDSHTGEPTYTKALMAALRGYVPETSVVWIPGYSHMLVEMYHPSQRRLLLDSPQTGIPCAILYSFSERGGGYISEYPPNRSYPLETPRWQYDTLGGQRHATHPTMLEDGAKGCLHLGTGALSGVRGITGSICYGCRRCIAVHRTKEWGDIFPKMSDIYMDVYSWWWARDIVHIEARVRFCPECEKVLQVLLEDCKTLRDVSDWFSRNNRSSTIVFPDGTPRLKCCRFEDELNPHTLGLVDTRVEDVYPPYECGQCGRVAFCQCKKRCQFCLGTVGKNCTCPPGIIEAGSRMRITRKGILEERNDKWASDVYKEWIT